MKLKNMLLCLGVLMVQAMPLTLTVGTARAVYAPDGSVQNSGPGGGTGGWDITDAGVCVTGIKSDGTMVTSDAVPRADCISTVFPNDADLSTSALCVGDSDANGGSHYWVSTCVANDGTRISLQDLDRTATNCDKRAKAMGKASGTMTSKCTGAWVYTGPNDDGGDGFCYTAVRATTTYPTKEACKAAVRLGTGYAWNDTLGVCTYAYGISGTLGTISGTPSAWSALNKKDGTANIAIGGAFDFSGAGYDTQGECLRAGGSWGTGVTKNGTSAIAADNAVIANVTATRAGCLECHNTISQYNTYTERWKESYLLTGHKNMLRKVTPGLNWAGPDGAVYTEAASGQALDFTTGKVTGTFGTKNLWYLFGDWMAPAPDGLDTVVDTGGGVAKYNGTSTYSCAACHSTGWSNSAAGLCSPLSSKTTSATCTAAGGTWLASTGVQGTTGVEPLASFPTYTSGITGKWDRDGILCSRCHAVTFPVVNATLSQYTAQATCETAGYIWSATSSVCEYGTEATCEAAGFVWSSATSLCASTDGHHQNNGILGQQATNLCFGCHQGIAKVSNHTGADADEGNPAVNIPVKDTDTTSAFVPEYSGHVLGNEFLNSPHARFSGSIKPNKLGKYDLKDNDLSHYDSTFNGMVCRVNNSVSATSNAILKTYVNPTTGDAEIIHNSANCSTAGGYWLAAGGDSTTTQGSCVTCHDPHQSSVPAVGAEEPFVRECTTCHVDDPVSYPTATPIAIIDHPSGVDTPREHEASEPAASCEICHMPKATSSGFPMHLWRINADSSYSSFPTSAEFTGNIKKNANTAADDHGYDAVWVDLDYACGQCHGGTAGAGAIANSTVANSGLYFTKAQLAVAAANMHNPSAAPTGGCTTCHDGVAFPKFQHPTTRFSAYEVANGVGLPSTSCQSCHLTPPHSGSDTALPSVVAACQSCHGATGAAHLFSDAAILTVSEDLHTLGAIEPITCSSVGCHEGLIIAHPLVDTNTPGICDLCHLGVREGVSPDVATVVTGLCNPCHGGSDGTGSLQEGAPYLTSYSITKTVENIHRSSYQRRR